MELVGSVDEVMKADNGNFKNFLAGRASGEDERPSAQVLAKPGR
jgi:hypothetical protein